MSATPAIPVIAKTIISRASIKYLLSLPLNFRLEIFKENKSILLIISSERVMVIMMMAMGLFTKNAIISQSEKCEAKTNVITAIALAGVARPLKFTVCDVSRLKIASLRAAHTGITDSIKIINNPPDG